MRRFSPWTLALLPLAQASSPSSSDSCAAYTDLYRCHANLACTWCSGGSADRCVSISTAPAAGETCTSAAPCESFTNSQGCNAEIKCKWCTPSSGNAALCLNYTSDRPAGSQCDKELAQALPLRVRETVPDRCAVNSNEYACHYNIECVWCKTSTDKGRCANWTSAPREGEKCDALVGCGGRRTQSACDDDTACKWCKSFAQGWPFCANATDDLSGAASCDKVQDRCAANANEYTCHYNIECIWCKASGGLGRCANWTSIPRTGESCDALVGCGGRRTQTACDGDSGCKWCRGFAQGWPFCANLTDDVSGSASCDKSAEVVVV